MSDSQAVNDATPESASQPAGTASDKREWAEKVLSEILRLMELPARLDFKDGADGGISVAIHFEEAVPGVQPGRRSHFIDSLQVIINKIVNRPGTERRWVTLGAGAHPEPRPPLQERGKRGAPAPTPAPPGGASPAAGASGSQAPLPAPATPVARSGPPAPTAGRRASDRPARPEEAAPAARAREPEEASLQVTEEPLLAAAARSLAEKSSSFGRFYAIAGMKPEDRARVLKTAAGVAGVKVTAEGEGRSRRVVFTPEKPAPMPKQAVPDYGDDE